jgi:putative SOS response-associated peptidase YedK
MCGRYGFSSKKAEEVYSRFGVHNKLDVLEPHYNISLSTMNPVIIGQSGIEIAAMVWGLIPYWAQDDSFRFKTINARVEGIESKPVYRKPFRYQRCLVPATGFYEWDKSVNPSQPYYFKLKHDDLFAFAGLYDRWQNPKTKKEIASYTIITTEANGVVGKIHKRMPVILQKEDEEAWLNPDIIEPERLFPLLKQYPDREMEAYPVSRAVNNPRNDTEELVKPVSL